MPPFVIDLTGNPGATKQAALSLSVTVLLSSLDGDLDREMSLDGDTKVVEIGRSSRSRFREMVPGHANAWIDSPIISRDHAKLSIDPKEDRVLYITDLGSTHGTKVNGRSLTKGKKTRVTTGDILAFGSSIISGSQTYRAKKFEVKCRWERSRQPSTSMPTPAASPPEANLARTFSVPDGDSEEESAGEVCLQKDRETPRPAASSAPRTTVLASKVLDAELSSPNAQEEVIIVSESKICHSLPPTPPKRTVTEDADVPESSGEHQGQISSTDRAESSLQSAYISDSSSESDGEGPESLPINPKPHNDPCEDCQPLQDNNRAASSDVETRGVGGIRPSPSMPSSPDYSPHSPEPDYCPDSPEPDYELAKRSDRIETEAQRIPEEGYPGLGWSKSRDAFDAVDENADVDEDEGESEAEEADYPESPSISSQSFENGDEDFSEVSGVSENGEQAYKIHFDDWEREDTDLERSSSVQDNYIGDRYPSAPPRLYEDGPPPPPHSDMVRFFMEHVSSSQAPPPLHHALYQPRGPAPHFRHDSFFDQDSQYHGRDFAEPRVPSPSDAAMARPNTSLPLYHQNRDFNRPSCGYSQPRWPENTGINAIDNFSIGDVPQQRLQRMASPSERVPSTKLLDSNLAAERPFIDPRFSDFERRVESDWTVDRFARPLPSYQGGDQLVDIDFGHPASQLENIYDPTLRGGKETTHIAKDEEVKSKTSRVAISNIVNGIPSVAETTTSNLKRKADAISSDTPESPEAHVQISEPMPHNVDASHNALIKASHATQDLDSPSVEGTLAAAHSQDLPTGFASVKPQETASEAGMPNTLDLTNPEHGERANKRAKRSHNARPSLKTFASGCVAGVVAAISVAVALLATIPVDVQEEAFREY